MKRIRQFFVLLGHERGLLIESFLFLIVAQCCLCVLPFRYICALLGKIQLETLRTQQTNIRHPLNLRQLNRSIFIACKYLPWKSRCLVQAIAVMMILKRHQSDATCYLGIKKNTVTSQLEAHAWVRCGDVYVIGEGDLEKYTVLLTLANVML